MAKSRLLAGILVAMVSMAAVSPIQADELFDTAESAKHREQGFAYLKMKKYDAAIKEFEESAEINPEAEAFYYLGYAYYLKNRIDRGQSGEKSRENFEKAYEIDPNFSPTRYRPSDATEPAEQADSKPTVSAAPLQAEPSAPATEQPKP